MRKIHPHRYWTVPFLMFGQSILEYWDFIRIPALLYFIIYYYKKFKKYTDEKGLGFSIILLFSILSISIIITLVLENTDPLNAAVMVSNAFTSNGYVVLGDTTAGKLTSLVLVWGGYIISGAATATLVVAMMTRHYRSMFKKYDEKLDELKTSIEELGDYDKKLDELKTSIEELKDLKK